MSQYGHIDLRVSDMAAARKFYDQLLPELGFTERWDGETWTQWATTEPRPSTAHFALTEAPGPHSEQQPHRVLGLVRS